MAIFFKFKSAKDYNTIPIEGICISVANIRRKIAEKMCMGRRGCDFDLLIYDAQTNEEYSDEAFLVPKNSSVLVRRVPTKLYLPITSDDKEKYISAEGIPFPTPPIRTKLKMAAAFDCVLPEPARTLGVDNIEDCEVLKVQHPVISKDEDSKIKELVTASASEWQRHIQDGYSMLGKGFQNGGKGRNTDGVSSGRKVLKTVPHLGYICHRCGTTGHYIQHCPTNGDPAYDVRKVRIPKGIPRTMLAANPDGVYVLPTGETAVLTPNDATFDNEMFGLPSKRRTVIHVPPEYFCPLCREVMKDAMISSKCCFKSYCDRCIRDQIISKARCACGATNILADHLLPNITLREAIDSLLESSAISSGRGSAGSKVHSQDIESVPASSTKTVSLVALASEESTLTSLDVSDTKVPIKSGNTISKKQNVKDEVCVESLKVLRAHDILQDSVSQQRTIQSKGKFSFKSGNRLHEMVIHDLPMAESDMIGAPSNRSWRDSVMDGDGISSHNACTASAGLCYQEGMMELDPTSSEQAVPSMKSYEQNHVGNPQVGSVNDCGEDLGLRRDLPNMDAKRRRFHRY